MHLRESLSKKEGEVQTAAGSSRIRRLSEDPAHKLCRTARVGPIGMRPVSRSPPVVNLADDTSEDMEDLLMKYGLPSHAVTNYDKWPTICMVPMELKRDDKNKCYDPVAVQIGLSKCLKTVNTRYLQQLQRYKSSCVRQLINRPRRPGSKTPGLLLHGCLEIMKCLYPEIQACHSKLIALGGEVDDVARIMLLDGCFILHRLLKHARRLGKKNTVEGSGSGGAGDDDWTQVGGRCFVWQLVTRDLLLLENQIPFFVLQELFDQLKNNDEAAEGTLVIVRGSLVLFRSLCPQMLRCEDTVVVSDINVQVHHLLHLFYLFVGFPDKYRNKNDVRQTPRSQADDVLSSERPQWIPGAKELEEAGIRFRKRKKPATFLDIKFNFRSGVLEIPPLELYDYSEALFRNLIAFEQTYPGTEFDISAYAVFMNCLITTPEDMRILHLRGILTNMINGEQDASRFFNRICSQVHFPSVNYLVQVMDSVSKYKDSRRHQWRAALVRDYFSNPWVAISMVAAVLLLGLTVLQTFFTVYPYFKPRN